ncbi:MAG: SusC/RagA family TonB-linked outer membrane protein, partial [Bacteroidota bacterium]
GEPLIQAFYPRWANERYKTETNQIVLSPRAIIEPIKDLKVNLQLNYRRNDNQESVTLLTTSFLNPDQSVAFVRNQEQTVYAPSLITNEYFSPNLFADYTKTWRGHNFNALVGYQSEVNEFQSLGARTDFLITDNVISLTSSLDDDQIVSEGLSHWATQSLFGRLRYNYKEKYLFEISYRADGSSRFEPGRRWARFPSYSAGYNIAREEFWPFKSISTFKLRGSQGTLGSQNVAANQFLSLINVNSPGTAYLFNGGQQLFADLPGLESESLTWETIKTLDFGLDINALDNKLGLVFDWYRTDTEGVQAQGADLPAVLGDTAPLTNIGVARVEGWEFELSWRQNIGSDFSYFVRGVLSDFKRTWVEYPNETNLLNQPFAGQDIGDVWGLTWDGWFQTQEEVDNRLDQSFVAGNFTIGDTKYADLNGDGVIDRGTNTLGDSGDFSVIANETPRYQYSVTLGGNWKAFDFNVFVQGVGKRDFVASTHQRFRGPAQGPFHAMVFEEHLDYYRPEDTTSPLGPNTDAYFPKPYAANPGNNRRNYNFAVDRYVQDASYIRLKSVQLGYTIPNRYLEKFGIRNFRIYATGENLFFKSDLLFYDPETIPSGFGNAQSYPLSRIISTGINLSF